MSWLSNIGLVKWLRQIIPSIVVRIEVVGEKRSARRLADIYGHIEIERQLHEQHMHWLRTQLSQAQESHPKAQMLRTKMGYVSAEAKPVCENCWGCRTTATRYECSVGGFGVRPRGWCPGWVATAEWVKANPDAARQMSRVAPPGAAKTGAR